MTTKQEIVRLARETLGTPYQHQQRVNGLALDCAGVPVYVGLKLGLKFEDITDYGKMPNPEQMRAALDKTLVRINKKSLQPGDVVWIRFQREPQHLAIVGDYPFGGLSLIHATNGAGLDRVVEHRLDEAWLSRIVAAWRYAGVEQ